MSFIDQLKAQLSSGTTFKIGTECNSSSIGKITLNNQNVGIDIVIDTILHSGHPRLYFRLTNVDFKLERTESMGIVYQENGIVRIERAKLYYSDEYNQYVLSIKSTTPFAPGRVLISFSNISPAHNIYDFRSIDMIPLPPQGPGSGCRPGLNKGSLEQTANPFK